MSTASPINTNVVKHVLEAFVEEHLVDVPADHSSGEYMIRHDTLVNHVRSLTYDDLVGIMFTADDRMFGV